MDLKRFWYDEPERISGVVIGTRPVATGRNREDGRS
jgi:hypothetical protein